MSITLTQTPATASLSQSPIIFSVIESGGIVNSSSFQYMADLYYWTGSLTDSSSVSDYTLVKYPNSSQTGIFDLNRIINSTLPNLAIQNTSNVVYFAAEFYYQYLSGSTYITGSNIRSNTYKALDGYAVFQEPVNQQIYNKTPHWPLITDGPATQSVFDFNRGFSSVYVGDVGTSIPTKLVYSSNLGNADYTLSGSTSSSQQIQQYPIGISQSGFPLTSSIGLNYYTIQAYSGSTPLGTPIKYNLVCNQKYPNIRIKWKNRFGQFDWFNFNMVNRQSFQTETKAYQPQLGSWESTTLGYNSYESSTLNYIADSKQSISVKTDWISEDYNELLKQLLVSDEIYWYYEESSAALRPITITTSNLQFKTGVVDKLIQYSFDFNFGQAYKLII
jgi:hypothetical protein